MNLRRIINFFGLLIVLVLSSESVTAQSQLAAISQDGLMQIGSNHPFLVEEYVIDLAGLGISTDAQAQGLFRKYVEEGFTFEWDAANGKVYFKPNLRELSQFTGNSITVDRFNQKLQDVYRLRR